MKDINKTLKELKIEDFIWIVYLFIAGLALFSNFLERKAILNNDGLAKKEYKTINICLLSVGFFIYLYFLIVAYQDVKEVNSNVTLKELIVKNARFVACALFIVGSVITILCEINSDEDTDINLFA